MEGDIHGPVLGNSALPQNGQIRVAYFESLRRVSKRARSSWQGGVLPNENGNSNGKRSVGASTSGMLLARTVASFVK